MYVWSVFGLAHSFRLFISFLFCMGARRRRRRHHHHHQRMNGISYLLLLLLLPLLLLPPPPCVPTLSFLLITFLLTTDWDRPHLLHQSHIPLSYFPQYETNYVALLPPPLPLCPTRSAWLVVSPLLSCVVGPCCLARFILPFDYIPGGKIYTAHLVFVCQTEGSSAWYLMDGNEGEQGLEMSGLVVGWKACKLIPVSTSLSFSIVFFLYHRGRLFHRVVHSR